MASKRYHLIISGRVQGVSYRMSAWEQARRRSLSGWVRNRDDGRVEMLIEGEESSLDSMLDWARKGPRFAHVSAVDITRGDASGEFSDFEIR